ncbi:MAG: S9 family peptidase [Bacteroidetes bacterium]|nr:S9 family peptidase [Bacteroidota bacterium]
MKKITWSFLIILIGWSVSLHASLSPEALLSLKQVSSASMHPNGQLIAYTLMIPRSAGDKPGPAYNELWVYDIKTGKSRPFITGKVNVRSVEWSVNGESILFLTTRGSVPQVFGISLAGGEAQALTNHPTAIRAFRESGDGKTLYFTSQEPEDPSQKKLKDQGYDFIYFEENWTHINLYESKRDATGTFGSANRLTDGITVREFELSPDEKTIAFSGTPKNLIDDEYVDNRIYLLDLSTGTYNRFSSNKGKLGTFSWSSDSKSLVYTGAFDENDHAVSQLFYHPLGTKEAINLTPASYRGHISEATWADPSTILYLAAEGTSTSLYSVSPDGKKRQKVFDTASSGLVFSFPDESRDRKRLTMVASTPMSPNELYMVSRGEKPERLTVSNPVLASATLGKQEVITYSASDGVQIEGLLIYPVGYEKGKTYPLITIVHGGPESHYSNGWITGYGQPGQVFAAKGYLVFYPNYRASTGYGLEFARAGFGDAAGREFDDIADGIRFLFRQGLADSLRSGMMGGSYGGYASAWFGTRYTDLVRAVHMFVGISNVISKTGTTDIPREELLVHAGKPIDETWDFSLRRSPIYYAGQSKTAFLISGGTEDTRVHPGQSLEMYRALKRHNHPAVRLVQYPGEPHGNLKQTSRADFLFRTLAWMDWYVRDLKPLNGPMPPLDISHSYGLK